MKRYQSIRMASTFTAVLPTHKTMGKLPPHAIKLNAHKYKPLMRRFEYLLNLGEVRATQADGTLVNGMLGHANCNNGQDTMYLPISMGYRACYKRYMASLGYNVQTTAMGKYIVEGDNGKEVNFGEYVTFPTYLFK
jgi:hypothetical protein